MQVLSDFSSFVKRWKATKGLHLYENRNSCLIRCIWNCLTIQKLKSISPSTTTSNLKISLGKLIKLVHSIRILSKIPNINFSRCTKIENVFPCSHFLVGLRKTLFQVHRSHVTPQYLVRMEKVGTLSEINGIWKYSRKQYMVA